MLARRCSRNTGGFIQLRVEPVWVETPSCSKARFTGADQSRSDKLGLEGKVTEDEIRRIAIDWIRFNTAERNSQEQFDTAWATTKTLDLLLDGQYEDLWSLILVIHSLDQSDKIKGMLSAGPVEDLLGQSGERFIGRIEEKAKSDPGFARVLGGVWRNDMSEDVWARVQAVWDRRGWDGVTE